MVGLELPGDPRACARANLRRAGNGAGWIETLEARNRGAAHAEWSAHPHAAAVAGLHVDHRDGAVREQPVVVEVGEELEQTLPLDGDYAGGIYKQFSVC